MGRRFVVERDTEDGWDLYVRDTLQQLSTRDAYPEAYAEAEAFMNGGNSHGGNSHTHGGNRTVL